jgi:hypothetical protein
MNHFTWAEAVVAMGIALTTAHPSQMAAVAALDRAPLDAVRSARLASIGKLSSRLVVSMVMAPTPSQSNADAQTRLLTWRRSDSRLSERRLATD